MKGKFSPKREPIHRLTRPEEISNGKWVAVSFYSLVKVRVLINFCKIDIELSLDSSGTHLKHPSSRIVALFNFGNHLNSLQKYLDFHVGLC